MPAAPRSCLEHQRCSCARPIVAVQLQAAVNLQSFSPALSMSIDGALWLVSGFCDRLIDVFITTVRAQSRKKRHYLLYGGLDSSQQIQRREACG